MTITLPKIRGAANLEAAPVRGLRESGVLARLPVSRSEFRRMVADGRFPAGTKISERVVIWDERVVDAWLEAKFERGV